jgi:hypothetical protein
MKAIVRIGILLMLLAGFTNPDLEDHNQEVRSEVMQFITKEASTAQSSNDALAQLGEEQSVVLGNILIQNIANDAVHADNYLLFSLTTLQIQYEERNIGIGCFGQVFLFDDLEDALKNMEEMRG